MSKTRETYTFINRETREKNKLKNEQSSRITNRESKVVIFKNKHKNTEHRTEQNSNGKKKYYPKQCPKILVLCLCLL